VTFVLSTFSGVRSSQNLATTTTLGEISFSTSSRNVCFAVIRDRHRRRPNQQLNTMAPTISPGNLDTNVQALLQAFAMIIVSEIGDKTFLIAAILAMRHPRLTVFIGAFGSLVVMSVLSAAMGHLLPTLIPRSWTQFAASVLFIFFGVKMLLEAREMKSGNEKIQEELREAEKEIKEDEEVSDGVGRPSPSTPSEGLAIQLEEMEGGRRSRSRDSTPSSPSVGVSDKSRWAEGARNFCSLFLGPVFVQAFVLTFLGEWGDRSQIATIALAAAHVRVPPPLLFFSFSVLV
jgi:putative Ca2+/H+ antiporter (TMEM165/GDT1 family)